MELRSSTRHCRFYEDWLHWFLSGILLILFFIILGVGETPCAQGGEKSNVIGVTAVVEHF